MAIQYLFMLQFPTDVHFCTLYSNSCVFFGPNLGYFWFLINRSPYFYGKSFILFSKLKTENGNFRDPKSKFGLHCQFFRAKGIVYPQKEPSQKQTKILLMVAIALMNEELKSTQHQHTKSRNVVKYKNNNYKKKIKQKPSSYRPHLMQKTKNLFDIPRKIFITRNFQEANATVFFSSSLNLT